MTFSRRRVFSLLGGIAAAIGFGGVTVKAAASTPNKYVARMNDLRAARQAAPAVRWGNTATRGINGLCREYHPVIHGNGIDDDEPGFASILACEERGHKVPVPMYRVYRIHRPMQARGDIHFRDGGNTVSVRAHDPKLTAPLKRGHARLFWVEGSLEWSDDNFKVVDIPA